MGQSIELNKELVSVELKFIDDDVLVTFEAKNKIGRLFEDW